MKQDNCIFCKLANGDIPTNTIFEDEDFRVFLDAIGAFDKVTHCPYCTNIEVVIED